MNRMKKMAGTGTAYEWLVDGAKALVGALIALGLIFLTSIAGSGCGNGDGGGNAPVYNSQGKCVTNVECPECGYIDQYCNCITINCGSDTGTAPADGYYEDAGAHQPDYVAPPTDIYFQVDPGAVEPDYTAPQYDEFTKVDETAEEKECVPYCPWVECGETSDGCDGTCFNNVTCNMPPKDYCVCDGWVPCQHGDAVWDYESIGQCVSNQCSYSATGYACWCYDGKCL